jgi:SnoaL-like domain
LDIDDLNATTDVEKITRVVFEKFKLAQSGDFEGFKKLHLVGAGFSLFDSYPPFERFDDSRAISREEEWIHTKLPKYSWKIDDLKITVLGQTTLTTLRVKYFRNKEVAKAKRLVRGTLVFVKKDDSWKILHEHWSKVEKPVKHPKVALESRVRLVR